MERRFQFDWGFNKKPITNPNQHRGGSGITKSPSNTIYLPNGRGCRQLGLVAVGIHFTEAPTDATLAAVVVVLKATQEAAPNLRDHLFSSASRSKVEISNLGERMSSCETPTPFSFHENSFDASISFPIPERNYMQYIHLTR